MHRQTYIGCYLYAKLPKSRERQYLAPCPNCKRWIAQDTSPCCGQPVIHPMQDRMETIAEFCGRLWGEADAEIFTQPDEYEAPDGWAVILGNQRDRLLYTYTYLPDETEAVEPELPMPNWIFIGDWERLIETFKEHGIEYQKKYGIVTYWS